MTEEDKYIWVNFVSALETAQVRPDDQEGRLRFARRFRSELVLLSFWLNQMKVTGCDLHTAEEPPDQCDFCGLDLAENGLFVDGQITDGRWSFMCLTCYGTHGVGIGWGIGQLYRLMPENEAGERNWLCIAGGDPAPGGGNSFGMA